MASSSDPERTAVVSGDVRLTTQQLSDLADGGAGIIAGSGASHVAYVGTGGAMLPLLIFASARAGLTFTPINYRLSAEGIKTLIARLPDPLVVIDSRYLDELGGPDGLAGVAKQVIVSDDFLAAGPRRRAGRGVRRPGLGRHRAVHVGHYVATQGRRAHPQQPDQLRHWHSRIRVGRADRCRVDLRAAVPHRGGQRGPVEPVRRPEDGLSARLRSRGVGAPDRCRARHQRDGGADHAGPHRHRVGGRTGIACRRCAIWPTAARRCRYRWCARLWSCCRTSASSTPTA